MFCVNESQELLQYTYNESYKMEYDIPVEVVIFLSELDLEAVLIECT